MSELTKPDGGTLEKPPAPFWKSMVGGGLGVGLALVVVPTALLMLGLSYDWFDRMRLVGLPILAIFGIIILFGTLALVAMLFQSMGLSDKRWALALPAGSVRAAIALSLIVLFAIISIMLFQSMLGSSFELQGVTKVKRDELVSQVPSRVLQVAPAGCAASVPSGAQCADDDLRFDLQLLGATPNTAASDLAKQLLVMVGTLMTAMTSFYFATRGQTDDGTSGPTKPAAGPSASANTAVNEHALAEHADGCDVPITDPTPDDELPPARGGVVSPSGT